MNAPAVRGCKYIYQPAGQAGEYAPLATNPYKGCGHGCLYCYVPAVTKQPRPAFNAGAILRPGFLDGVRADARKYQAAGIRDQVMLSFSTDPYHLGDTTPTRQTLEILIEHGLAFCTLTKGGTRALRDIDLFRSDRDAFASTLTSLDDAFSQKWEPKAALPSDRIAALKRFHEAGIFTWVSLEPTLDVEASLAVVDATHGFVDLFKVGRANYLKEITTTTDWRDYTLRMIDQLNRVGARRYIKRDLQRFLPDGYPNPLRVPQHHGDESRGEPADEEELQPQPTPELGRFAAGVSSWRRTVALAAPGDRWQVFQNIAVEAAACVAKGLNRAAAAAALSELALAHDLIEAHGEDAVQGAIAEAFASVEAGFEKGTAPQSEPGKANGHDASAKSEWTKAPPRTPWSAPPFAWRDPATVPRRVFLYGHYYARGFVAATIADGGVGKSLLKLVECLAIASGRNLLGIPPVERVRALYWNGDDPFDEVERRIHALCQHYDIDGEKLFAEQWLFVGTRNEQPLCIGQMARSGVVINENTVNDLCAFINERNIGLACFDPFKATHRVPENDNTNMDAIAEAFSIIAERTNAAIGLDHHIRKPAAGQGEATTADARGASALINKVRLSRVLNGMTTDQAVNARIKESDRRRHFRADTGKMNLAPPGEAVWYQITPVLCANGQDTPTVTPWKYPNAFDAITPDHMRRVRAMAREDGTYRKDPRADKWIGHAVAEVVELDTEDEADRRQIKELLKTWFANGVLDTEERKDEARRLRTFVVPGNWNEEGAPV